MSVGPVRLDGDRPVKGRGRLVELAIVAQRIGEVYCASAQSGLIATARRNAARASLSLG